MNKIGLFMGMQDHKNLTKERTVELLGIIKSRFEKYINRHKNIDWSDVEEKLRADREKLWSLNEMELTGGEPDVVEHDISTGEIVFMDCSKESPIGRRSLCYDRAALEARKKFKPENSAVDLAATMGIEILTEEQYRKLQELGPFDTKTSSWIKTPAKIRQLGGAIFCDFRYGTLFLYHNGADSYYASRGFRGFLRV